MKATTQTQPTEHRPSDDQVLALDRLDDFLDSRAPLGAIKGAAGTGKTTTLRNAARRMHARGREFVVSAMTNRAAGRIRQATGLAAQTTYSASLRPRFNEPYEALDGWLTAELKDDPPEVCVQEWPKLPTLDIEPEETTSQVVRRLGDDPMKYLEGWTPRERKPGSVLLVDEASMYGNRIHALVQSVFETIVLIGDPNQLPPVKDDPLLRLAPEIATLETIFRHAGNSQVLDAAQRVLRTGKLDLPERAVRLSEIRTGVPLIVHANAIRVSATRHIRRALGLPADAVVVGERLVCRENFRREDGVVNNSLWTVTKVERGGWLTLRDDDTDNEVILRVAIEELGQDRGIPFRFGYTLTAHTAQGCEWPMVTISGAQSAAVLNLGREFARAWRYTSVTRAKEQVFFSAGLLT
jgi:exodeoxyribonuclease V